MGSLCTFQMHSQYFLHFAPARSPQANIFSAPLTSLVGVAPQSVDGYISCSSLQRQTIRGSCSGDFPVFSSAVGRQSDVGLCWSAGARSGSLQGRRPGLGLAPRGIAGVSTEPTMGDDLTSGEDQKIGPVEELSEALAEEVVREALVWASLHGAVVGDKTQERSGTLPGVGIVHVPLSLLPTPFSRAAFTQALDLATHYNTLVDRVSQDTQFLHEALAQTRKADRFTARIMDIYDQVLAEGITQEIQLGLHRSDYMLDMATGALLQVEMNTISSSFAGLGALTSKLHRYLVGRFGQELGLSVENVPDNSAADDFAEGLGKAWLEYGDPKAVVLMIVHGNETNMYDQHWLSFKLYESFGAKVIRRTLAEVNAQAKLDAKRTLVIGEQPIAVVYYRSGYSPDDYLSDDDWDARLLMERSIAVKCPSISYHLVGAKKIQQELAKPGVLERFFPEKEVVAKLRESFAGLWSLESDGSGQILEEAVAKPEGFVLKPQREGGGNNIYGKDVATTIKKLKQEELAGYILMQRIFPAVHDSYLIRDGVWRTAKTISELGIFGTYLRNGKKEVLNKQAGHLVRSKVADSDEGGVAAGYGVLDSPYLV
jgi:glutathione synthetase